MNSLPGRIMEYAKATPEATPIRADDLLHLGNRAAVVRALSRLVRSDRLLRICRGVYMRPIQTRFGLRAPSLEKALASLAALWGEVIVPNGGGAANWLGLTTQNTVRSVYLTSGPDRLDAVIPQFTGEDLSDLAAARAVMPPWMAEPLSRRLAHG